ncbi:MAG: hypothetical protein FWG99_04420 [Treponema sp.]|nr:hypothetical protein [Treponema sp.]
MNKIEQIKSIENGNGIQHLLNSANKILNNPLFMFDSNYNMIAFTDVSFDDPIWSEFVTTGTLSLETLDFLAKERMTEDVVNADKIVTVKRDKLKYARISGHIRNRYNIAVGLATMYDCNTPFDAENTAAFEALVDKIVCEIKDYDYFSMFAMTYHEDKINLLLDGTVKNPLLYNPHAQILYSGFEDYLYVAVVSVERNNILENVHRSRLEYFKSMLKTKYKSFKYSVYEDYIVVLMSSKLRNFYGAPFFSIHADLFGKNKLSIGISSSFENMYELRIYYDQAVAALKNGLSGKEDVRIFVHNGAR